jgi:hypothetical protein
MEVLVWIGMIATAIGGIGILIAAFSTSTRWGLGCLLMPPVSLLFLVFHWDVAKNLFFLQLVGIALFFMGTQT